MPITEPRFQPKGDQLKLLVKSGYREISNLIDHNASNNGEGLQAPFTGLLQATFPSLSGAGRFDFVPNHGPLRGFEGQVIVPLAGDRAPFATSGKKLNAPIGFKLVRVDLAKNQVHDFISNAKGGPASRLVFLIYLHLIAVTLLVSYRTGLKLALWDSVPTNKVVTAPVLRARAGPPRTHRPSTGPGLRGRRGWQPAGAARRTDNGPTRAAPGRCGSSRLCFGACDAALPLLRRTVT